MELVRRLATDRAQTNPGRHNAAVALVKINVDLARLGDLFKMALDTNGFCLSPSEYRKGYSSRPEKQNRGTLATTSREV